MCWVFAVLAGASMGSCAHAPRAGATFDDGKQRLILISIDGLRPEFYESAAYEAPNLKRLVSQGASVRALRPIFPSLTYPMHTTLVTGVSSAKHGILANTVFSPGKGPTPEWYWFADKIRVPTLWQKARDAGKTVAIVRWPASVGADVEWMVPEIFGSPGFDFARDWALIRKNTRPETMAEVLDGAEISLDGGYHSLVELDRFTAHGMIELLERHHPDLMLAHFVNLDLVQHLTGRASPQAHRALTEVDALIQDVLAHVNLSRTTVVILGDHGFLDFHRVVNVNALFREKGWLDGWKAVAHAEGGQAAIYVSDPKLAKKVLAELKAHAEGHYRIIPRPELDRLRAYPDALCALEAAPDTALGPSLTDPFEVKVPVTKGAHGHLPDVPEIQAGLIAVGPGIAAGRDLGTVRAVDVAPTLTERLGIGSFAEAEGKSFGLTPAAPSGHP